VIVASVAFLVLIAGSLGAIPACVMSNSSDDVCGVALSFGWTLVLIVVACLGSVALSMAQRRRSIPVWLLLCFLAIAGLWFVGALLQNTVRHDVLMGGLVLILDLGIIYSGWQFIRA